MHINFELQIFRERLQECKTCSSSHSVSHADRPNVQNGPGTWFHQYTNNTFLSSVRPRLLRLSLPCTHARCSSILPPLLHLAIKVPLKTCPAFIPSNRILFLFFSSSFFFFFSFWWCFFFPFRLSGFVIWLIVNSPSSGSRGK